MTDANFCLVKWHLETTTVMHTQKARSCSCRKKYFHFLSELKIDLYYVALLSLFCCCICNYLQRTTSVAVFFDRPIKQYVQLNDKFGADGKYR